MAKTKMRIKNEFLKLKINLSDLSCYIGDIGINTINLISMFGLLKLFRNSHIGGCHA
jgi:hypothetical protein